MRTAKGKHKKLDASKFAGELAGLAGEREFSEWLSKSDPDPQRFTIEIWPGASTYAECCLCDGFDWVCPACKSKVNPVTYVPLPDQEGCHACRNQALKPIRLEKVWLGADLPAPFLVGADGKLRAICRDCLGRCPPWLKKNVDLAMQEYFRNCHNNGLPF